MSAYRPGRDDRVVTDRHTDGASVAAPAPLAPWSGPSPEGVRAGPSAPPARRTGRPDERNDAVRSSARADRRVPAALIALAAIPVLAGVIRVTELAVGAEITPDNERFFASPAPVVVHVVSAVGYCLLGAFQFAPGFRRRRPGWHRRAGRLLVPLGFGVALSGLWMTVFYPKPPGDGELVTAFRLLFGSGMAVAILLGFAAIRRRDIAGHRAWMTRGYAIALGAGTQVFTLAPLMAVAEEPAETPRALLMAAAWVINLAVAEWFIRRRPRGPVPSPAAGPSAPSAVMGAGAGGGAGGGLAGAGEVRRRVAGERTA